MRTQDRKRTLGKNKGNPNKVQALVNNSINIGSLVVQNVHNTWQ